MAVPVMSYVFDLNPYVEAKNRYLCDKLTVNVVDKTVSVYKTDANGVIIAGVDTVLTKTLATDAEVNKFYTDVIAQLYQGDVLRYY